SLAVSIHVALHHVTDYRYDRPIRLGPQVVRLRPAPHCRTRVLSYSLKVLPTPHFLNWQQDPQSNHLARLVFPEPTTQFRVEVDLVAEMSVLNPFDFFLEPDAEQFPFAYEPTLRHELEPFLATTPLTPRFAAYLASVDRTRRRTIDFLVELNQRLSEDIQYLIRLEPGVQTPEETLTLGSGSCRDSAWLLVQLFRHLGIAARFASGYLIQLTADQKSLDGPSGPEADFTDLHAWCEVYLPGAGWIGLDPTSGLLAGEGHLPLACSPDPSSAAPITGLIDECEVEFVHEMRVTRIHESPRVTKPYTPEQWAAIEALGHAVDARLEALDVRLTMGGEPTFVSLDDPDGAEWNTTALGPTKRVRAGVLFRKLWERYAPQGLAHYGQGKWYPGEQLPRWSLNLYWRKDGEPIWQDPALICDEAQHYGADDAQAARFTAALATRLGVAAGNAFPAFEDLYYYLWRERRLPGNVSPEESKLEDALERARLMRIWRQGLAHPVGQVLPLKHDGTAWQSGPWFLRAERCYLLPGDSAMGFRLPLDSQPWVPAIDYPWVHPEDPAAPRAALPSHAALLQQLAAIRPVPAAAPALSPGLRAALALLRGEGGDADVDEPLAIEAARAALDAVSAGLVRTAVCVEPRDGRLHVFMPPLERLEAYLALVAAVEATAAEMATAVVLEGYEPPRDPRLQVLRVTPDPGVIEVNIHPAANWAELVDHTTHLYESARESRLTTEKFMLDGRHTGTGGGNHLVLGGATPADSPFLRRPDLLRSLISYWHNHPALSYLYSGLFIGPTSQAPRIDEARNDALYELEIAFKQMPHPGQEVSPWVVDRLLRNLLVDVTGNTHRAEFCIDKLYSPDSATGRLGLLELRAFEMPPHAQMSLTQQLLLRALLARFWAQPYAPARLARWGTELHDRYLLPWFVWQDLAEVVEETRAAGFPMAADWFAPHWEFRFPRIGDYEVKGIALELRHALEPWHVLGEEGAQAGTVRYVDSSVERLQVHLTGLPPDRYQLACNGRAVPLRPTGRVGEYIAGVRYRAWQPPSSLHPLIAPHAPLTFDLYDTWSGRALGGCQYHVAHPGGRSHDSFPVNAFEAESRRLARFVRHGHRPGPAPLAASEVSAEHPFTLDLRR
ncbi:MAG: transglutaminase family protein, partial [Xanthomonadales bacterium]|nr:transglutaminase family protein [Xanthomonadales bacterium]